MNLSKKLLALMTTIAMFVVYWYLRGMGYFIGQDVFEDTLYSTSVVVIAMGISWIISKRLIKQGRTYSDRS